ncbi:TPR-like protein [Coprinopsis marcescibilis]|uniref:TPR-like protein n=1 Tax=Coprinopsis marcescibilis TaxID=230819 RepID=A0A5C3L2S4_COPMA|nr:TPR-like protein [Coprinopsis marcescibilis]
MGRTKTKKKGRSKPENAVSQLPGVTSSNPPTIEALQEKAQELIIQCDYELAVKFVERILEQDPTNVEAKEMLGVSLLEMGELEQAKQVFESLIPPHPGAPAVPPPSAHLYLAQLNEEDPRLALQHFQSAVNILLAQLKGKERANDGNGKEDEAELKQNAVRALIGQVEIWMDPRYDLCFEPEAEKTCEDLLNLAIQTDSDNPEALQALASVRMSQQRPEDAKQILEKAWGIWKDLDIDDPRLPPIPTRLALVKLFLELALYAPALLVLHGVMASDDQDVEAWYLEGWCFYLMAEKAQEDGGSYDGLTWQELAKDSRDCLETCRVLHRNQEHPDVPISEHVEELIAKLAAQGVTPSPIDDGDDDGEWDDLVSEDGDSDVEMQ